MSAWDNATNRWYFYAPPLDTGGTEMMDYIGSKGYLDFTAANKNLGHGVGFWVNMPWRPPGGRDDPGAG